MMNCEIKSRSQFSTIAENILQDGNSPIKNENNNSLQKVINNEQFNNHDLDDSSPGSPSMKDQSYNSQSPSYDTQSPSLSMDQSLPLDLDQSHPNSKSLEQSYGPIACIGDPFSSRLRVQNQPLALGSTVITQPLTPCSTVLNQSVISQTVSSAGINQPLTASSTILNPPSSAIMSPVCTTVLTGSLPTSSSTTSQRPPQIYTIENILALKSSSHHTALPEHKFDAGQNTFHYSV